MTEKEHEQIVAFDTLFSTNHIQMLKIILPFMEPEIQNMIAIYIKFLELQYTITFCSRHPFSLNQCTSNTEAFDISRLCNRLLPFCNLKEKQQLEQIQTVIKSMEMYREMTKTMEYMKDYMPDMSDLFQNMQAASSSGASAPSTDTSADTDAPSLFSSVPSSGFDITNMIMNMMTPEQKEMYEFFKGDFQNAE